MPQNRHQLSPPVESSLRRTPGGFKIQNLDSAVFGNEKVLRLQIAVKDSGIVRSAQAAGEVLTPFQYFSYSHWSPIKARAKSFTLQQFRDDIGAAIALADVKDGNDVGMIKRRCGLRFDVETPQAVGLSRPVSWQDLDRDVTSKRTIACPVYLSHATRTQGRNDLV